MVCTVGLRANYSTHHRACIERLCVWQRFCRYSMRSTTRNRRSVIRYTGGPCLHRHLAWLLIRQTDPSQERQAELQGYLDRWQTELDHFERKGQFYNVELTGADVCWLAEQSVRDEDGSLSNLHLEGADLSQAQLEGAYLDGAHMAGANFYQAQLQGAGLGDAQIGKGRSLSGAAGGRLPLRSHLHAAVFRAIMVVASDASPRRFCIWQKKLKSRPALLWLEMSRKSHARSALSN